MTIMVCLAYRLPTTSLLVGAINTILPPVTEEDTHHAQLAARKLFWHATRTVLLCRQLRGGRSLCEMVVRGVCVRVCYSLFTKAWLRSGIRNHHPLPSQRVLRVLYYRSLGKTVTSHRPYTPSHRVMYIEGSQSLHYEATGGHLGVTDDEIEV